MLGAGIYALVGKAAALAGNTVWISFLLASLVALMTALSYAELSSFMPKAGGEYYYTRRAFGKLVAFLVSWVMQLGIGIAVAAVALGFGGYFRALTGVGDVLAASLLIAGSAGILIYGIRETAWVAAVCTVVEFLGLLLIVAVGIHQIGSIDYLEPATAGYAGVWSAAALLFFAFIGFEEIVQLSEETGDASRIIPLTILLSIAITTLLYILVTVCALSVLGWKALGESSAPLADVAAAALGNRTFLLLSVIALFSTGNTVLILMMSAARLLYGMAEGGSIPRALAFVHKNRKTPWVASLVVAGIALVIVVAVRDITRVANLTNFSLLLTFVFVNGAVIALRFQEPGSRRPFRVPGHAGNLPLIPVLGIISSLFMIYFVGWETIAIGVLLILPGLAIYLENWRRERKRRFARIANRQAARISRERSLA